MLWTNQRLSPIKLILTHPGYDEIGVKVHILHHKTKQKSLLPFSIKRRRKNVFLTSCNDRVCVVKEDSI